MYDKKTIMMTKDGNSALKYAMLFCVVFLISGILEWMGWRIASPGILLAEIPASQLFSGTLKTMVGALLPGLIFVLAGLIFPRYRSWTKDNVPIILAVGAAFFLLFLFGLVMWAP